MESISDLRAQIRQTEGWQLRRALSNLGRTYRLFLGNHRELRDYLEAHQTAAAIVEFWRDDRREEFEQFLDEVDRLLHNFVASVATFVDHTWRMWRNYPPNSAEVEAEYRRRIEETFASSPLAAFVKGLRNFTLHQGLALALGELTWEGERTEMRVYLDRAHLLDGEWSSPARAYLVAAPEKVDVAEFVDEYARMVVAFMDWLGEAWNAASARVRRSGARERELADEVRRRVRDAR